MTMKGDKARNNINIHWILHHRLCERPGDTLRTTGRLPKERKEVNFERETLVIREMRQTAVP